jgi:hypothetical protein
MNWLTVSSAAAAVVAVVLLAVSYGKYRAAAKLASTWEALARTKEAYANTLQSKLAEKEAALRKSEAARLSAMPASDLADLFRGMYGPRGPSRK